MSFRKFQNMFPDNGSWVKRLAPRGAKTIEGLFEATEYKGDPLLFSMHACLFADNAIAQFPATTLNKKLGALRAAMGEYHDAHGQWPHPAVLVGQVLHGR